LPQLAAGESSGVDDLEAAADHVADGLEATADHVPDGLDAAVDHVAGCLRCQAEVAAYRRILRHLRALRHDLVDPPPGALAAVVAALEAAAIEQQSAGASWAVRAAYVGGITVATAAAGAAGMLVWMNRRRLGLPAAS
jgi:hypothetical protein